VKHSTKPEFLRSWRWRWVVLNDSQISIYNSRDDSQLVASMIVDNGLEISHVGRIVTIKTKTRKLNMMAEGERFAVEWVNAAREFYEVARKDPQPYDAIFPIRALTDTRVYLTAKEYFLNVAKSLLSAKETIFICGLRVNPLVILTRPPHPTIRLDQLLRYKAEQGVKIFVLLYKEVTHRCRNII
jgi:hypothetical protein